MQQPPWPLVNGGGSTPGRAENEVTVNRRHLAEGLRFAVPLHMLEPADLSLMLAMLGLDQVGSVAA